MKGLRGQSRLAWLLVVACGVAAVAPSAAAQGAGAGVLRADEKGPAVRVLQEQLRALGYFRGPVTGFFGPMTLAALKEFQARRSLKADGVAGPATRRALAAALAQQEAKARDKAAAGSRPAAPSGGTGRGSAPLPPPDLSSTPVPAKGATAAPAPAPPGPGGRPAPLRQGGRLALTFDDGPDPALLPALLEALKAHRARATFFVVGKEARAHPEVLRSLAAAGHQVENHSFSHRDVTRLSPLEMRREILLAASAIQDATGRRPTFFRPPLGAFDRNTFAACGAAGHRLILWTNIAAPDRPAPGREALVARLLASAYDGAILMLHATEPETVAALPDLLETLVQGGYQLVTLEELLGGNGPDGTAKGRP